MEVLPPLFARQLTMKEDDTSQGCDGRIDYLRWSCDRLFGVLGFEEGRRNRIRTQAHAAFLLVPALVGIVIRAGEAERSCWLLCLQIALLCAAAWAVLQWYKVVRVEKNSQRRRFPAVNLCVFTDFDGTQWEGDFPVRLKSARDHLVVVIEKARSEGNKLAGYRGDSLKATILVMILAGLIIVTEVLS